MSWPTYVKDSSGNQIFAGGVIASDNLWLSSTAHATKGLIKFGASSAYDESTVRLGVGTVAPGVELDINGSAWIKTYARIGAEAAPTNVTAGDFTCARLNVGNVAFATGAEFQLSGDGAVSGWLVTGSASAPSNTTAGDLTATRIHLGPDAAFLAASTVFELQGTITGDNTRAFYLHPTISGGASGLLVGFDCITSISPNGTLAIAVGFEGAVVLSAGAQTVTEIVGELASWNITGGTNTVTRGIGLKTASPIGGGTAPTYSYGIYIAQPGLAGVGQACCVYLALPTAGTTKVYMEFDTANTAAAGAYVGKLPIVVGGAVYNLHYFA